MALLIPPQGCVTCQAAIGASNAEFGTSVTANATPHVKTTTPTQIVASTNYDTFGVVVGVGNVGTTGNTNTRTLVDIMTGGAGSEAVLIPNLLAGQVGASNSASSMPQYYFFPLYIQAGTRLSARSQSVTGSDTVHVSLHLLQHHQPGNWYGSRVTAYGPDTATSTAVSHTPTNNTGAYQTTTQITASTTNDIHYMQIGIDALTDGTVATARGLVRIAAMGSTNYVISDLPYHTSTTLDSIDFLQANFILAQMRFDIPAGQYLGVGAQSSADAEARGFAIYGVD